MRLHGRNAETKLLFFSPHRNRHRTSRWMRARRWWEINANGSRMYTRKRCLCGWISNRNQFWWHIKLRNLPFSFFVPLGRISFSSFLSTTSQQTPSPHIKAPRYLSGEVGWKKAAVRLLQYDVSKAYAAHMDVYGLFTLHPTLSMYVLTLYRNINPLITYSYENPRRNCVNVSTSPKASAHQPQFMTIKCDQFKGWADGLMRNKKPIVVPPRRRLLCCQRND